MPAKNVLKEFIEDGIYHIYNRGVAKGDIFLDEEDYKTFLFYLKIYLADPKLLKTELQGTDPCRIERRNFNENIQLICYCLMPNHFHLMLYQKGSRDITDFMRCLATNYSMYFNKKYNRVGTLFQGRYKAVLVNKDEHLVYLTKYIHLNPAKLCKGRTLAEYSYSSYQDYLKLRKTKWVKSDVILRYFNSLKKTDKEFLDDESNYQAFVEAGIENNSLNYFDSLDGLILEEES